MHHHHQCDNQRHRLEERDGRLYWRCTACQRVTPAPRPRSLLLLAAIVLGSWALALAIWAVCQ